ncbi:dephospho-CoA kinase [Thalassospira mesophila]|uniref:Dephospho-CoA kinase n=1 Tax=Thalassospira mesophila TaxID=1293891 RepID=A0A1Y2L4C6_9PROT|nr:dephospho-CoA kinase [Thalassospira mesophila]OSQ40390.1 dephospho-CoA kinase [Thalassospira mesophila]
MDILGLTGSIGMGKSTAAGMFRYLGVPVYDADANAHDLMAPGGAAFSDIAILFPDVIVDGKIDRQILGGHVFGNADALAQLEGILHPLIRAKRDAFIRNCRRAGYAVVVLDVPLLFETGGDKQCYYVAVVSAPGFIQRQRVLRRGGMSERKFAGILQKQLPDPQKRRRADFIIPTGLGRAVTFRSIQSIIGHLNNRNKRTKNARNRS